MSHDSTAICRVCRSSDPPLFNPCKCTGSMKHIHQPCLEQWLSHSQSQHCEICKHAFKFAPIYSPDAPASISLSFFLIQATKRLLSWLVRCARVSAVGAVWLVVVPFASAVITKFCFQPVDLVGFILAHFEAGDGVYFKIWQMTPLQITQ